MCEEVIVVNFIDFIYIGLPFAAWGISGCIKFLVNYAKYGNEAKNLIGYGGFPSTHTTVLSSVVFFTGFESGVNTPLFTLGLGSLVILIIDAHGLRRKVGQQAVMINKLCKNMGIEHEPLRERMGHTWLEIIGGLLIGSCIGYIAYLLR